MEKVKVTVITLILCLMSITSFGRETEDYGNGFISYESNGEYTLYIKMINPSNLSFEDGGIMVDEKRHELFLSRLNEAKVKYVEWSLTAKKNNVVNFSNPFKYVVNVDAYFKYGNEYHFQDSVDLIFIFSVSSDGKCSLVIGPGKLTSSSNRYITHDGVLLSFQSEREIDDFIKSISIDKIKTFINKPKTKDLFKD